MGDAGQLDEESRLPGDEAFDSVLTSKLLQLSADHTVDKMFMLYALKYSECY
jgi:hypothetical protein